MNSGQTIALPSGYQFENYRLEAVLGHGGFGITYRALDEDLQQVVAIKEYLPREVAFRGQDSTVIPLGEADRETFEWGLERFLDEARTLARFRHPNIVGVRRFLRANGTAYLVMDYCEGESLERVLASEATLSPERLEAIMEPLLDALEALHAAGVTHRDIKPGNIYLREDGSPVLLDFGAARQALAQHSRSVTAMATPGYAAFEQYSTKGKQGPWTDIYGLGATLYRCVTGQRPPDASDRMLEDDLVPAVEAASGRYAQGLLQQIDAGLKLRPEDRPQNLGEWFESQARGRGSHTKPVPREVSGVQGSTREAPKGIPQPMAAGRVWGWWVAIAVIMGFVIWIAGFDADRPPGPNTAGNSDAHVRPPAPSPDGDSAAVGGLIEGRYRIMGTSGEIVLDTVTGLEWQRCSLGQTWSRPGRTCLGWMQTFDWEAARQAADHAPGWRLPTIDELKTLTFCSSGRPVGFSNGRRCEGDYRRPTIVSEAFPDTPSSYVWSDSDYSNLSDHAWLVSFEYGNASGDNRGFRLPVRFVRGGTAEAMGEPATEPNEAAVVRTEIERLLNAIEEDLAADRLTFPPGGNAFERVQAILDLSPGDDRALEIRRNIIERYEELAGAALARGDFDRVESLLQRMDEVQPGSSLASGLRDELLLAREVRQREEALASGLIGGRYRIAGDSGEIVVDTSTGLEWQRCSLGQEWTGSMCAGEARGYTWEEARQAAEHAAGWRMPTIEELRTLVYCSSGQPAHFNNRHVCQGDYQRPTIVKEAFPNTPSSFFWSGSPSANSSYHAWYVLFLNGNAGDVSRSGNHSARLVRDGQ